eukprot:GHVT01079098.1.p2 GENE.GHVT01079098.1~~GHVT01079098.1.p2  ORF type:complete len:143 (-),score=17.50 GHVT01079098.1:274-702(-)
MAAQNDPCAELKPNTDRWDRGTGEKWPGRLPCPVDLDEAKRRAQAAVDVQPAFKLSSSQMASLANYYLTRTMATLKLTVGQIVSETYTASMIMQLLPRWEAKDKFRLYIRHPTPTSWADQFDKLEERQKRVTDMPFRCRCLM